MKTLMQKKSASVSDERQKCFMMEFMGVILNPNLHNETLVESSD